MAAQRDDARDPRIVALEARMRALGEGWAVEHAHRLTRLVDRIGVGVDHDHEVLTLAIWTHDWGAFRAFGAAGPDHPRRSVEVVGAELLDGWALHPSRSAVLLEAIARHDYRDPDPVATPEALLLREADMLDLIGAVGVAREFAWGPADDLAGIVRRCRHRLDTIPGRLTLPPARRLGRLRAQRGAQVLAWIETELSGDEQV
ncbi:hypothetical protein OEB99_00690 [Actinotalea sp. M2MS4P-6]|uniref:hypothetical protein n=1 Tax=Actinotalea sp. M2MS4P-6 TaxID=2983762 RepID=UPI0021E402D5|nr:hypothetical protein [Actinotalea sp. M2MS4P-6]MCV2392816.1 hypothetical protein [Actinotalea sp. M2MS4P-6]